MEAHAPTAEPLAASREAVADERLGSLVKRYVYASTAIFLVAGALGVVMRQSQADIFRIGDNPFYAMMTAHGLGTFMAWGAFAIMGLGFWVLRSSGFGIRPLGYRLANVTWWTTVAGTAGIVITTLFMGFAGSWVFLYPLPFFSADQWGDLATGLFSFSVLLVGVGILTWCAAILHTVAGPSNPARGGVIERLAVGLGIGILYKRLLASPERQIPYAVIPLTVIALDMLVATLPLAALLVVMIGQSIDSSITIDPLLAKNMLWFFGHPVVYLLLFPAVAAYYLLIPRYAKRPLAAGDVIAVAWLIGVIVNVIIWAHHIYVDYPQESIQSVLNVAMQPLTFSITLVSALSLYSLTVTMWRSDFEWNPASKFLVAGMFGWFTAGLSGVVNATIAFNFEVHNTLWIVGHFHHMALLNIGLAIFGVIYAFLPELTNREWYSRKLGDWHLWATLIGGYGNSILWYIQGLNGGPRRYSVLPETYEPLAIAGVPFTLLLAIGQLVFAWNLVRTLRGDRRPNDDRSFFTDGRQVSLAAGTLCVAVIAPLLIVAVNRAPTSDPNVTPPTAAQDGGIEPAPSGPGKDLFVENCGSCHTLAAAGTSGAVGPSLDSVFVDEDGVLKAIEIGGAGSGQMPAGLLEGEEAKQVAEYVAAATGTGG
jgi:cytochrome c oxidase subunit I